MSKPGVPEAMQAASPGAERRPACAEPSPHRGKLVG